jgi:hypothetical protein
MNEIKQIREAIEWIGENTYFWKKPFPISKTKELLRYEETLSALDRLEELTNKEK